MRVALTESRDLFEFPSALPGPGADDAFDSSDDEDSASFRLTSQRNDRAGQNSAFAAEPMSPSQGHMEDDLEYFSPSVAATSAKQPHLSQTNQVTERQSLLQYQLQMARTQRQAGRQGDVSPPLDAHTLRAAAQADRTAAAAQLAQGVSTRSRLLDVYGQVRQPRALSPQQVLGNAVAEPNTAYLSTEAETQVARRVRTSSTMNLEKMATQHSLSHQAVRSGTALVPAIVENQPELATTLRLVHESFASFREPKM